MAQSSSIGNIYVGIDFGATHSSISYIAHGAGPSDTGAFAPPPLDLNVDGHGRIPTMFDLGQHGNVELNPGWETSSAIIWPKLALLHYECRPTGPLVTRLIQKAEASWAGLPPAKMIAPFLRALFLKFLDQLRLAHSDIEFRGYAFHCTVTSPESWKLEDRERMKAAVAEADLASLLSGPSVSFYYISEQEAAALSVYNANHKAFFQEGSLVTVCDGGGLTVDIASYVCGIHENLPAMSQCGQAVSQGIGGMSLKAGLDELVRQQLDRRSGRSNFLDTCSSASKTALAKQCDEVINRHGEPGSQDLHILAERFEIPIKRRQLGRRSMVYLMD
ncbi:hypothetical protein B0T16DRAFT_15368 [Cercophora newfieldiana]|uniref:Actin-like ATPase domain-containing protein n=1 Tax=Cercophora newfieldiana TaxID=92897 RepID=A0AA39YN45_9PEZI|nr:hypothetical protein B0T16DRAFT_15368 [Cercophora newfieldiana]